MKAALIQTTVEWENPSANRRHFTEKINSIADPVDLIVLPEMFTTGFTMKPSGMAETMQGETVQWMLETARKSQAAICGSLIISESDHKYNRLLFVLPSGEIFHYDKRHLFTLAGEDKVYKSGQSRLIIDYKGFKICPLVCYDLRFPVFSRNTEAYDLLIYVANWPKPRVNAWDILLKARSVENMCFTIGVNRIGSDSNNLEYSGHTQAVDFLGNCVLESQEADAVFTVSFNKEEMLQTRAKLAFLDDRDHFTVSG